MNIMYLTSISKDVKKLKDEKTKNKLKEVIAKVKVAKTIRDITSVKKLSGHPQAYRIRVGEYRLGFYLENGIVLLARFVKRNDIYKLFP